MKTILCYGDSNTWGSNPVDGSRLPREQRWPGVLAHELGAGFQIIEEGLPGRTTVFDDPFADDRNGKSSLIPCLASHAPLDAVTILLGTNDLKRYIGRTALEIATGVGVLVELVRHSGAGIDGRPPIVLLLAPPVVGPIPADSAELFAGAEASSRAFAQHYRRVASAHGCLFLDTAELIVSSPIDGVHLDPSEHLKLGRAVAAVLRHLP